MTPDQPSPEANQRPQNHSADSDEERDHVAGRQRQEGRPPAGRRVQRQDQIDADEEAQRQRGDRAPRFLETNLIQTLEDREHIAQYNGRKAVRLRVGGRRPSPLAGPAPALASWRLTNVLFRAGGSDLGGGLGGVLLEVLLEQRGQLARLDVVGVAVGPGLTRLEELPRHARALLGDRDLEHRVGGEAAPRPARPTAPPPPRRARRRSSCGCRPRRALRTSRYSPASSSRRAATGAHPAAWRSASDAAAGTARRSRARTWPWARSRRPRSRRPWRCSRRCSGTWPAPA